MAYSKCLSRGVPLLQNGESRKWHALTVLDDNAEASGYDGTNQAERLERLKEFMISESSKAVFVNCVRCGQYCRVLSTPDPTNIPDRWNCDMATPKDSLQGAGWEPEQSEFIQIRYAPGSLVWAQQDGGGPWWPAMVDFCPDTDTFYYLELEKMDSEEPPYYNVTFLYPEDKPQRDWIKTKKLKPFSMPDPEVKKKNTFAGKSGTSRVDIIQFLSHKVRPLDVVNRLKRFSFLELFFTDDSPVSVERSSSPSPEPPVRRMKKSSSKKKSPSSRKIREKFRNKEEEKKLRPEKNNNNDGHSRKRKRAHLKKQQRSSSSESTSSSSSAHKKRPKALLESPRHQKPAPASSSSSSSSFAVDASIPFKKRRQISSLSSGNELETYGQPQGPSTSRAPSAPQPDLSVFDYHSDDDDDDDEDEIQELTPPPPPMPIPDGLQNNFSESSDGGEIEYEIEVSLSDSNIAALAVQNARSTSDEDDFLREEDIRTFLLNEFPGIGEDDSQAVVDIIFGDGGWEAVGRHTDAYLSEIYSNLKRAVKLNRIPLENAMNHPEKLPGFVKKCKPKSHHHHHHRAGRH